jgi:hypothetical protein
MTVPAGTLEALSEARDDEQVLRRRLADMAVMALGEVTTGASYSLYHKAFREHFIARLDRAFAYKPLAEYLDAARERPSDGLRAALGLLSIRHHAQGGHLSPFERCPNVDCADARAALGAAPVAPGEGVT